MGKIIFQSALIISSSVFFLVGERMVYLIYPYIGIQQSNFLEIKNHYSSKNMRFPRFMRH